MKVQKFEDLEIWKNALKITKLIYDVTMIGEFQKDFELKNQIRRAVISISSCIVEGFEKNNNNEFIRYLGIAKGSCGEVRNQLIIAHHIDYVVTKDFERINELLIEESARIGAFIRYLEKQRADGKFIKKNKLTR